ncbi:MAG TPA: S8 family serine peptidase [Candidatus Binatia bacterium]
MLTKNGPRARNLRELRGRLASALVASLALALCVGPVSSVAGDQSVVRPPYDEALLAEIAEAVLAGLPASPPEATSPAAPSSAPGAAASDAAAADASAAEPELAPDELAAELAPAVEGVNVLIPPGAMASRKKPDAKATATYLSNSSRQRADAGRALSFSSGVRAPASGLDPALEAHAHGLRDRGRDTVYGFVLLRVPLDERVEEKLAALGVRLLGRHDDHHKARLPIRTLSAVAALPEVEWVGVSTTEQKSSPELAALRTPTAAAPALDPTTPIPVVVNLFEADEDGSFRRALEAAGAAVGAYDADLHSYEAVATGPVLERLAALDFVLFIETIDVNPPGHDQSAPLMDVDMIRPGSISYGLTRFSGAPIPVGIIDSGAMIGGPSGHVDLAGKRACGKNFTSEPGGAFIDLFEHGTHLLGTIAGTGTANPRYRGVAPGVGELAQGGHLRVAKVWDKNGQGNTDSVLKAAMDWMTAPGECSTNPVDPAPMVINYSGGAGTNLRGTDEISRKADYRTWINAQLYVVCSGNGGAPGTIGTPGVAKNVLAVGNVFDKGYLTVGDRKSTSSQGPTGDGRMKPNVVAPGATITSAWAATTNGYKNLDGCSMATPHVTGLAASLLQHYPQFQFRPAMTRAHLMATALGHDGAVGKSNEYGLGRVSSYVAHWDHPNSDGWETRRFWGTINSFGFAFSDITVPPGAKRLVVVLTWDEPPASAGASRAVLYDIDLYVDRNVDCGDPTGACGEYVSVSSIDNVEYLVVHDPPPGTYRLKVVPTDAENTVLPWGMSALIVRGDVLPLARVQSSPPAMTAYASGPTSVGVGSLITVGVNVANDSWVASGVHVHQLPLPSGVLPVDVQPTRLDGTSMAFTDPDGSITLGNIPPSWSRTATYSFLAQTPGSKTFSFRVWSENSGEITLSRTVNVVGSATSANLGVASMSTNPSAPSGAPGSKFKLTSTVQNGGGTRSTSSTTRFYLSSDAVKSADDRLLTGIRSVPALDPGAGASGTTTVTIPASTPLGSYFVLACADDKGTVVESNEDDNCAATSGAVVTVGQPDLVEGQVSNPPATKKRGTTFSVGDTAQNLGNVAAKASKTRYYLSTDATKSSGDKLLSGARAVPALAPGAAHTGSKSVKIPAATVPGSYYVLACADDTKTSAETSESNNCAASSSKITVTQ